MASGSAPGYAKAGDAADAGAGAHDPLRGRDGGQGKGRKGCYGRGGSAPAEGTTASPLAPFAPELLGDAHGVRQGGGEADSKAPCSGALRE